MSLVAMTRFAIARKHSSRVQEQGSRIAVLSKEAGATTSDSSDPGSAALELVVSYIPTEVVTTYVAVLSASRNESKSFSGQWLALWIFLALTPITVWVLYARRLKVLDQQIPIHPRDWPLWEMCAASLAFAAWTIALPNSPILEKVNYPPGLGTIAILGASFSLGLLTPLFVDRSDK
jgi:hypothetical protein